MNEKEMVLEFWHDGYSHYHRWDKDDLIEIKFFNLEEDELCVGFNLFKNGHPIEDYPVGDFSDWKN